MVALFVLFSLTVLSPQLWPDWNALNEERVMGALFAAWLALTLFLLRLGRRGWRALQQRPHPFLPN